MPSVFPKVFIEGRKMFHYWRKYILKILRVLRMILPQRSVRRLCQLLGLVKTLFRDKILTAYPTCFPDFFISNVVILFTNFFFMKNLFSNSFL